MPFAKHFHIHRKSDQPTNVIMQPLCTYTRWLLFFLIQWRVIRYSRWYNQCQDSGKDLMQIPKQEKKNQGIKSLCKTRIWKSWISHFVSYTVSNCNPRLMFPRKLKHLSPTNTPKYFHIVLFGTKTSLIWHLEPNVSKKDKTIHMEKYTQIIFVSSSYRMAFKESIK